MRRQPQACRLAPTARVPELPLARSWQGGMPVCAGFTGWGGITLNPASRSPDLYSILGIEKQFLALLDIETGVPGIDIPHRNAPVFAGSMGVRKDLLPQSFRTNLLSPVLPESDEELLIAGKSVLLRRRLSTQGRAITIIGRG